MESSGHKRIVYMDYVDAQIKAWIDEMCSPGFILDFAKPDGVLDLAVLEKPMEYILVASSIVDSKIIKKGLKLIQKTGAGTENIDVSTATALGIPVSTTPGMNSVAVAELVMLFILALYRQLIGFDRETKEGRWLMWQKRLQCYELKGKKVGLIGFGHVGRDVSKRMHAFGAEVSYYDIKKLPPWEEKEFNVEFKPFEKILQESDIISLHIPLTSETRGLIGKEQLAMIKRNSIIVNTSRGKIIDEEALIWALESGRLAGAALDTFANEPVEPNNPLLTFRNVITTPHIGAGTIDTWNCVLKSAFCNIERVAAGNKALNVINGV